MIDRTQANADWWVADETGKLYNGDASVTVAVLQDIRTELKQLNRLLNCSNFLQIPGMLRSIKRNTARKRKAT